MQRFRMIVSFNGNTNSKLNYYNAFRITENEFMQTHNAYKIK